MSTQQDLDGVVAARYGIAAVSASLMTKTADCGCGCGDQGEPSGRRMAFSEPVVVPGLVNSSQGLLDAKALVHVLSIGEEIGTFPHGTFLLPVGGRKVGAIGSHSRVNQALQAVASYAIPGDMSDIRSPIRSTVYEAITPGGGRNRRNRLRSIGRSIVRRCPPGYENGGRFANATFSNCGALIFDLADGGAGENLVGAVRRTVGGAVVGRARIRDVGAGIYGDSPIQSRAANIPPAGRPNKAKRASAMEEVLTAASASTDGFVRLVRKDGIVVKPLVGTSRLLKQKNHPEIVGSTMVLSATRPNNIGGEEIKLLGNGLAGISYALPGGHSVTVKPKKTITPRRAAALHRQMMAIREEGDEHARALKMLAEKNAAELTFAAEYKNIDGANDLVTMERNGMRRTVQKWAFLTWYAANAPGRTKTSSPWRLIDDK